MNCQLSTVVAAVDAVDGLDEEFDAGDDESDWVNVDASDSSGPP